MKGQKGFALIRVIEIARNILAELLNYLLFVSVAYVIIIDLFSMQVDLTAFIVSAAVPIFYYFSREIGKRIVVFFLLHFIPPLAIVLLYHSNFGQKIIMFLIAAIMMAVSISRRLSEYNWGMSPASLPAVVAFYLILYLLDLYRNSGCALFLLRAMIVFVVGYFVYYFLKQFLSYVDVNNRTTDHIPVMQIFLSAAGLVIGCTTVGGIILLLTTNRALMEKLGNVVQYILFQIINFVFQILSMLTGKRKALRVVSGGKTYLTSLFRRQGIPQWLIDLLDILFTVLGIVCITAILFAFTVGTVKLIKAAFRRRELKFFGNDDGHRDKIESLNHKKFEKEDEQRASVWKQLRDSFTYAERIRKIFRHILEDNVDFYEQEKKDLLLYYGTARECMRDFFPDKPAEAITFAQLYEKARYGTSKCTFQDFKLAKELANKLK